MKWLSDWRLSKSPMSSRPITPRSTLPLPQVLMLHAASSSPPALDNELLLAHVARHNSPKPTPLGCSRVVPNGSTTLGCRVVLNGSSSTEAAAGAATESMRGGGNVATGSVEVCIVEAGNGIVEAGSVDAGASGNEHEGSTAAGSAAGGSMAAGIAVAAEEIGEAPKGNGKTDAAMEVVEVGTVVGTSAGDGKAEGRADGNAEGSAEGNMDVPGEVSELGVTKPDDV